MMASSGSNETGSSSAMPGMDGATEFCVRALASSLAAPSSLSAPPAADDSVPPTAVGVLGALLSARPVPLCPWAWAWACMLAVIAVRCCCTCANMTSCSKDPLHTVSDHFQMVTVSSRGMTTNRDDQTYLMCALMTDAKKGRAILKTSCLRQLQTGSNALKGLRHF